MDENAIPPNSALAAEPSKKYIRTFAGDMETLKQGDTPELAPLSEHPIPPSAVPATPIPSEPSAPNLPSESDSPQESAPQSPSPVLPPIPEIPPVSSLKTYAADFSDRMKKTSASAATVLAAEQDAGPVSAQSPIQGTPSTGNILYLVAGIILLLAGAGGAYIAYTRYQAALTPVALAPSVPAPIFVDEREQISINGLAPLVAIQQSVARPLAPNAIRLLYLATTSAKSVLASLPVSAPDILVRNINTQGSMAGVVNSGGVQSPFFILSVSSYGDTFSGMLSWESLMPRMLGALFPAYVSTVSSSSTTPPAAPAVTTMKPGFYDDTVANHDVRVYRDQAGRSVVLYGYWNQTTLVIARDPAAFTEILGRLATARAQN